MALSGMPKFRDGDKRVSASGMTNLVRAVEGLDRRAGEPTERHANAKLIVLRKARLLGYAPDEANRLTRFRGHLVSGTGALSPTTGELEFRTFRSPLDELPLCVPKLETHFESMDPRYWVPVALFELCGEGVDDPPPPPPRPTPGPSAPPTQAPTPDPNESENPPGGGGSLRGDDPPPLVECGYAWYVLGFFIGTCAAEESPNPLIDRIVQLEATVAALVARGVSLGR